MSLKTLTSPYLLALAVVPCLSVFVGSVASAQPAPEATADVELYDYVVQEGDSCAGIAGREFGDRKAYDKIHKYNDLGKTPHRLKKGLVLRLPRPVRTPDAKLESHVGNVEYRKAAETLWGAANQGMDIFRAWRVWSHERSTAVLVFRDDSVLSLRDDTVVVIYGPSAGQGQRRLVRAELETGSLRSRLAALEGGLLVDTESSTIQLEKGSTVITASKASKRSTLSNHEGGSVAVRQRSQRGRRASPAVAVAPGKGTWVDMGKAPAPPRDLPASPEMLPSPPLQVSLASSGVTLIGRWKPVPAAIRYRVEVATDPNVRIVVAAFEVANSITSFEARGLKPGSYYVSVASIDDKGLESVPSKRQKIETLLLKERLLDESAPGTLSQGSQLLAPDGITCSLTASDGTSELALLSPGPGEVRCRNAKGYQSNALGIHVVGTRVAFASASGGPATVARGETSELLLETVPALPKNARLRVDTGPQVDASVVAITPDGIRLQVRTMPGTAPLGTLRVYRQSEAGEFLLTALSLEAPEPPARPAPISSPYPRIAVGAFVGLLESRLEDGLENPQEAPLLGARATIAVSRHFELEAETLLARRSGDSGHLLASNQLLLAWRQQLDDDWVARVRLGPALWHNDTPETPATTRLGGALGVSVQRNVGPGAVRLDVNAFALAGVSYRVGTTLGYQWDVDLLGK